MNVCLIRDEEHQLNQSSNQRRKSELFLNYWHFTDGQAYLLVIQCIFPVTFSAIYLFIINIIIVLAFPYKGVSVAISQARGPARAPTPPAPPRETFDARDRKRGRTGPSQASSCITSILSNEFYHGKEAAYIVDKKIFDFTRLMCSRPFRLLLFIKETDSW